MRERASISGLSAACLQWRVNGVCAGGGGAGAATPCCLLEDMKQKNPKILCTVITQQKLHDDHRSQKPDVVWGTPSFLSLELKAARLLKAFFSFLHSLLLCLWVSCCCRCCCCCCCCRRRRRCCCCTSRACMRACAITAPQTPLLPNQIKLIHFIHHRTSFLPRCTRLIALSPSPSHNKSPHCPSTQSLARQCSQRSPEPPTQTPKL